MLVVLSVEREVRTVAGAGRRVIVVDDDDSVRDSLAFLLETAGYTVDGFSSPMQCLLAMQPGTRACLVVDQHMPEMTGLEFLAELQRRGLFLPAVLITGSPSPDLVQRASALDVQMVMPKPLLEDDLLRFVAAVLGDD